MVAKPDKFYTNDERVAYLKRLFASEYTNDNKEAFKLVWMWVKTEVFEKRDLERVFEAYGDVRVDWARQEQG